MDEMYGVEVSEKLADEVWIREMTEQGLVLLHKDKRIRYAPLARAALMASGARNFALANGNLKGEEMVRWYTNNLDDICRAVARRGPEPYFYHVYQQEIVSMRLG